MCRAKSSSMGLRASSCGEVTSTVGGRAPPHVESLAAPLVAGQACAGPIVFTLAKRLEMLYMLLSRLHNCRHFFSNSSRYAFVTDRASRIPLEACTAWGSAASGASSSCLRPNIGPSQRPSPGDAEGSKIGASACAASCWPGRAPRAPIAGSAPNAHGVHASCAFAPRLAAVASKRNRLIPPLASKRNRPTPPLADVSWARQLHESHMRRKANAFARLRPRRHPPYRCRRRQRRRPRSAASPSHSPTQPRPRVSSIS